MREESKAVCLTDSGGCKKTKGNGVPNNDKEKAERKESGGRSTPHPLLYHVRIRDRYHTHRREEGHLSSHLPRLFSLADGADAKAPLARAEDGLKRALQLRHERRLGRRHDGRVYACVCNCLSVTVCL